MRMHRVPAPKHFMFSSLSSTYEQERTVRKARRKSATLAACIGGEIEPV